MAEPDPTTDRGETMIDVTALAVAQMRAARAAVDAKADYHRVRERWLAAGHTWSEQMSPELHALDADLAAATVALGVAIRARDAANRAYQRACGDALAEALEPPPTVEQPGLFG